MIEPTTSPRVDPAAPRAGLRRAWEVFRALTVADLRVTHDLRPIGILKWMLEPVSYMFVYFFLIATVIDEEQFAYPLYLLCALIPWRFFMGTFVAAMDLLPRYSFVITNTSTPTFALPMVTIASEAANMVIALLLFVPAVAYYGIDVWPAVVWLPVLLTVLVLLTTGPAYFSAVVGLYFPDYRGVVQNLVRATFFVSSALLPLEKIRELPREAQLVIRFNPLTGLFDAFRSVFRSGRSPEPIDLLIPVSAGVVLLLFGVGLYAWRMHEFAKEV